tara:strand:+ start:2667 stop:3008 length:342 start_codon:yes stop_codon:yes gene_type:complete
MTDLKDEVRRATRLLQDKEYELLTAMGLKVGEEPNEAQRIEVLGKLTEFVRQRASPELQEAMKAAQSRTLNYSHPIDAMAVALVQGMEAEARMFWEATYQPHVMKVKRPPLRD